jgi:hypothetical protein
METTKQKITWREAVKLARVQNVQAIKEAGTIVVSDGLSISAVSMGLNKWDYYKSGSEVFITESDTPEVVPAVVEENKWKHINMPTLNSILESSRIAEPEKYEGLRGSSAYRRLRDSGDEITLRNGIKIRKIVTEKTGTKYEMLEPEQDLTDPIVQLFIGTNGSSVIQTPSGTELLLQQMEVMLESGLGDREYRSHDFDEDNYDEDDEDEDYDGNGSGRPPRAKLSWSKEALIKRAANSIVITPDIYFQFVKSKMTDLQLEDLTDRLRKLSVLVKQADEIGQTAVYESLALQIAIIAREQEAASIGCGKRIDVNTVKHFIGKIEGKTIKFDDFENFPRIVPVEIATRIKAVRETKVFDKYKIVYVDYTKEKVETNEQKIRTKDPILFGTFDHEPQKLYFIIDWIDEYCDLTLDKMVGTLSAHDPNFALDQVPDLDKDFIKRTLDDVEARHLRLKNTNSRNYKQLMREEEQAREDRREALRERNEQLSAELASVPLVEEGQNIPKTDNEGKSFLKRLAALFTKKE